MFSRLGKADSIALAIHKGGSGINPVSAHSIVAATCDQTLEPFEVLRC
jgi:hypothetical protein